MKKNFLGLFIISSVIIWSIVIIMVAIGMGEYVDKTLVIIFIALGAVLHILLIWGLLTIKTNKEILKK
jgi:hypothetical protein